jgi:hypothetical protein
MDSAYEGKGEGRRSEWSTFIIESDLVTVRIDAF